MGIWFFVLISGLLLSAAAALMCWHVRAWRATRSRKLEPTEEDYHRRQYRRRMQTSAMLGVLAVALLTGQLLDPPPHIAIWYLGGMLFLVVWLVLLALLDITATKYHFGRLRHDYLIKQAQLRAELNRIQQLRANGKSKGKKPELDSQGPGGLSDST